MEQTAAFGLIAGTLVLVLTIGALKQRAQLVLWFFVRMVLDRKSVV